MQTSNMATFSTPQDYNKNLIANDIDIVMIEYIDTLNTMFYNIDISFMIDFMELVGKNECIVPHHFLQKYGVINVDHIANVKTLLDNYKFQESIDYLKKSSAEFRIEFHPKLKSAGRPEIMYLLHPRVFKLVLIRGRNTLKFATYYIFLEECVKYYNGYQASLKNKKIEQQKQDIEKQEKTIEMIVEERVPPTEMINKKEYFMIIKIDENKYVPVCGQDQQLQRKTRQFGSNVLVKIETPNAKNNLHRLRDRKDKVKYRRFHDTENEKSFWAVTLNQGVSEEEFMDIIRDVNSEKYKI